VDLRFVPILLLAFLAACGGPDTRPLGDDTGHDTGDAVDTGDTGIDPGPLGFIGSPCESTDDCEFEDAQCVADGYPGRMCTVACDEYCPDEDGHPVTYCVEAADLPASTAAIGAGACHSRCDFGTFPQNGCREGYGCAVAGRANQPGVENYVCLPNRESELSQCYDDLADRGVAFEPTIIADAHPDGYPGLTCQVEDALYVLSPVYGVELQYVSGEVTERVAAACDMAHALADTLDDVAERDVVAVQHYGTYVCRTIAGTSSLSRHAYGDAIDFASFELDDGTTYTLIDDWEHDTYNPVTPGGIFLYDAAYRWYDNDFWNIILTPNYNAAHDNHFHVDLTPFADYIGVTDGRYIGPAVHPDCGGPLPREYWMP
jgi:hypothetical protein